MAVGHSFPIKMGEGINYRGGIYKNKYGVLAQTNSSSTEEQIGWESDDYLEIFFHISP